MPASVKDFFETVVRPIKLRGKSPLTIEGYDEAIRVYERYWRALDPSRATVPLPLDALSDELVGCYLLSRSDVEPASRNKHLRYLSSLAKLAASKGFIPAPLGLKEEDEPKRKRRCWSIEEVERLLQVTASLSDSKQPRLLRYRRRRIGDTPAAYWWLALILVVYNTGVRISAVMSIRVEDLDLARGRLLVRAEMQKDKEDQEFSLLPETIAALQLLKPQRLTRLFQEWPFDKARATGIHRKYRWSTLTQHLSKLLGAAGLPTTRLDKFHKLRRTFCTQVARKRGKEIAREVMGHSTQQVTNVYIDDRFMELPSVAEILTRPKLEFQLRLLKPEDRPPQDPPAAKVG